MAVKQTLLTWYWVAVTAFLVSSLLGAAGFVVWHFFIR